MSDVQPKMPEWQCHKKVRAAKIMSVRTDGIPAIQVDRLHWEHVSMAFIEKHKPEVGGYLVEYEDGYRSYSPAAAFESGYTRI